MLHHHDPCAAICDDIASLLFEVRGASRWTQLAAAEATRDLSAAMHHALGKPDDPLWREAVASLARFVDLCNPLRAPGGSTARKRLRRFVDENADLLPRQRAGTATKRLPARPSQTGLTAGALDAAAFALHRYT
ncbi:MAG TPA: hypothetical protein VMH02_05805 [Verrucomicrobiae bacterium]|nr:hypothetical protein [Verrucomicrobiae bacterium]